MSKTAREVIADALQVWVRKDDENDALGGYTLEFRQEGTDIVLQALKEEGYAVVPKENVQKLIEMVDDYAAMTDSPAMNNAWHLYRLHYRAMISAADGGSK